MIAGLYGAENNNQHLKGILINNLKEPSFKATTKSTNNSVETIGPIYVHQVTQLCSR